MKQKHEDIITGDIVTEVQKIKTAAKVAPKITFEDVFGDDRVRIIKDHESKDPENVYMWEFGPEIAEKGVGRFKEVVKGTEHGSDVLVRMPRDVWEKKRDIETERSYQSTARKRGFNPDEVYSTGNLKQFARDVK